LAPNTKKVNSGVKIGISQKTKKREDEKKKRGKKNKNKDARMVSLRQKSLDGLSKYWNDRDTPLLTGLQRAPEKEVFENRKIQEKNVKGTKKRARNTWEILGGKQGGRHRMGMGGVRIQVLLRRYLNTWSPTKGREKGPNLSRGELDEGARF